MKILILNGSPRPNGNTAKMVAAFSESAENSGHHVVCFNVCKMNIKGCLACEYCQGKEGYPDAGAGRTNLLSRYFGSA